jgi:hypothetical protein
VGPSRASRSSCPLPKCGPSLSRRFAAMRPRRAGNSTRRSRHRSPLRGGARGGRTKGARRDLGRDELRDSEERRREACARPGAPRRPRRAVRGGRAGAPRRVPGGAHCGDRRARSAVPAWDLPAGAPAFGGTAAYGGATARRAGAEPDRVHPAGAGPPATRRVSNAIGAGRAIRARVAAMELPGTLRSEVGPLLAAPTSRTRHAWCARAGFQDPFRAGRVERSTSGATAVGALRKTH